MFVNEQIQYVAQPAKYYDEGQGAGADDDEGIAGLFQRVICFSNAGIRHKTQQDTGTHT
jgi:hypothetical protein